jgi:hypothetical protein
VGEDLAFLSRTDHGVDLNPEAPEPGLGSLRGPFKTLLFVNIHVHCSQTGDLIRFPFSFGHVEDLRDHQLEEWIGQCVTRLVLHELDEALSPAAGQ